MSTPDLGQPTVPPLLQDPQGFDKQRQLAEITRIGREADAKRKADEQAAMRTIFDAASGVDPATEADAVNTARELGVARRGLPEDLTNVKRMANGRRAFEFYTDPKLTPEFRERLKDVKLVRLLHDDLGNLKTTVDLFDGWSRNQEAGETQNEVATLYAKRAVARMNGTSLSPDLEDRIKQIEDIQKFAATETDAFSLTARTMGQFVGPALTALGAGATAALVGAPAGPAVASSAFTWTALGTAFTQSAINEFGNQYETTYKQLVDAGVPADEAHDTAMQTAAAYGLLSGLIETGSLGVLGRPFVGAGKMFAGRLVGLSKATTGKASMGFAKALGLGLIAEPSEEFAQGLLGGAAENIAAAMTDTDIGPTPGEALRQAGESAWQAFKGAAALAVIGPSLQYSSELGMVNKAKANGAMFDRLAKAAAESEVLKRTPAAFADVIGAQAKGPLENVYVEGPKLAQALTATGHTREQLAKDLPDVAAQLAKAERTGDDVVIPMGDFAAHVAPTELYPALKNSIRLADGYSIDRAEEWLAEQEQNKAQTDAMIAEAASKVATWDQEAREVEKRLSTELQQSAKLTPAVSDQYATLHRRFVETQAAREGTTPAAFDAQHRLSVKVAREGAAAGAKTLDQFAGMKSQRANLFDFAAAQKMIAKGVPLEKVRQKTGWFVGHDGLWRYEISDKNSQFIAKDYYTRSKQEAVRRAHGLPKRDPHVLRLDEVLYHPSLFDAYPHLADVPVTLVNVPNSSFSGWFDPTTGGIGLNQGRLGPGEEISTLLHEVQHLIQAFEGFAMGGNAGSFTEETLTRIGENDWNRVLQDMKLKDPAAVDYFNRLEEARKVFEANPLEKFGEFQQVRSDLTRENPNVVVLEAAYLRSQNVDAFDAYLRLAGEVEARNTASRRKLSYKARESARYAPEKTAEVPTEALIFRFGTDGPIQLSEQSTRLPSSADNAENPKLELLPIDYLVALTATDAVAKNAEVVKTYVGFKAPANATPEEVIEAYVEHMRENLVWLHNLTPEDQRKRAKLWYDGGRLTIERWAQRYGISEMQTAAVIAVLSPQNDWFMNMSQAERILDMVFAPESPQWSPQQDQWADEMVRRARAEHAFLTRRLEAQLKIQAAADAKMQPLIAEAISKAEAALDAEQLAAEKRAREGRKTALGEDVQGPRTPKQDIADTKLVEDLARVRERFAVKKAKIAPKLTEEMTEAGRKKVRMPAAYRREFASDAKKDTFSVGTAIKATLRSLEARVEDERQLNAARGKTLAELLATPATAARWIRSRDEMHNDRSFRVLTPEGGVAGWQQKQDEEAAAPDADAVVVEETPAAATGGGNATMMWKSYGTIAKALRILGDGAADNVFYQLGMEHKVRNFYNNLFNPKSDLWVTIDTHAKAAGLIRALGAGTPEVNQTFGSAGASSSTEVGLNGLYPYELEAYRRAAEDAGILPREMQSITWEAVRRLFTPAQKRDKKLVAGIDALWAQHGTGALTAAETRAKIFELAGGMKPPVWAETPFTDAPGRTYQGPTQAAMDAKLASRPSGPQTISIGFEVAPNPNDQQLTARWKTLTLQQRIDATREVVAQAVAAVTREFGVDGKIHETVGGFLGDTNPSLVLEITRPELAVQVAQALGQVLMQKEMVVASPTPAPGLDANKAVQIVLPAGYSPADIEKLYDQLWTLVGPNGDKLVGGHTVDSGIMTILDFTGLPPGELTSHIQLHLGMLGHQFAVHEAEVYSNLLTVKHENTDGLQREDAGDQQAEGSGPVEGSDEGGAPGQRPGKRERLDRIRDEATRTREAAIGRAEQVNGVRAPEPAARRLAQELPGTRRGEFDPATNTIWLHPEANATTVLHEMSHFWLSTMFRMAALPTSSVVTRKDAQSILDWFGVEDLTAWFELSFEEQAKHHEAWAYNAEAGFFGEGRSKGADEDQARAFRNFGRWVRATYRDAKTALNAQYKELYGTDLPSLTPEVRAVFDRMLASEDAIALAEAEHGMAPLLKEKPDGMTDADWADYQLQQQDSSQLAIEELQKASLQTMRWVGTNTSRIAKQVQAHTRELRAKVEAQERAKVEQEPIYRAIQQLRHGVVDTDGTARPFKLNLAEFRGTPLGDETRVQQLGTGPSGMLAADGLPLDIASQMLGFVDGLDLVRQLVAAPPIEEVIQQRSDARMLAEYSDLMDPEKVKALIEKALHNDARNKMVAAELRWLSKVTTPVRMMIRAARDHAREFMGAKRIGSVKPHQHALAETRARREAERFLIKGELSMAASAKRRELLEAQMEREALSIRAEIEKTAALVKNLFKPDAKLGATRNVDYVAVARYLAASFGLAPGERTADAYIKQLQAYNPEMAEQLAPQLELAQQWAEQALREGRVVKSWRDLTVDEFRSLHEAMDALWHQAKREQQFESNGKLLKLRDVAGEIIAQDDKLPPTPPVPMGSLTPGERAGRGWHRIKQLVARPEHWAFRQDGAEKPGAFTRYFWDPIRGAVNRYVTDRNRYIKRAEKMLTALHPKLKQGLIEFRDSSGKLLHVFGRGNGGFGHAELVGALLHIGNEGNLRRLLVGSGWSMSDPETGAFDTTNWNLFVEKMIREGFITPDVMDYVQQVWDLNEELKPIAQKAHRTLFGFYFNEVEAVPVTMMFDGKTKTYRGGYMPAKLDPDRARSAARIQSLSELEGDFRKQFATTGRGFTKDRAELFAEPLLLDVNLVPAHLDDVLRFSHLQPAVRDVERLAKEPEVATALEARHPGVWQNMLLPWLQRVASQSVTKAGKSPDVDNFWRHLRSSAGLSTMFANVGNALQQLTGVVAASLKVSPRYLFKGLSRLLGERGKLYSDIAELSPFMANRQNNQTFDALEQLTDLSRNRSKFAKARAWVKKHGYFMQTTMQNMVDSVVWSGAFQQSLDQQGKAVSDADAKDIAVKAADAAVRMTQSSFDPTDVAQYEEGTPFYRVWTMFSGYFNTMANLQGDQLARMAQKQGFEKAGVAFQMYLAGFAVPMLLAEAVTRTARGSWDDEDEDGDIDVFTLDYLFMAQLRSAIAEIPVAGPAFVAPALNMLDNQPWNDRMTTSPSVSLLERTFGGTVKAGKTLLGMRVDKDGSVIAPSGETIRDPVALLGVILGLPLGALGSRAGYGFDVAQGNVEPSSPLDYARGLVTGTASRASQQ